MLLAPLLFVQLQRAPVGKVKPVVLLSDLMRQDDTSQNTISSTWSVYIQVKTRSDQLDQCTYKLKHNQVNLISAHKSQNMIRSTLSVYIQVKHNLGKLGQCAYKSKHDLANLVSVPTNKNMIWSIWSIQLET